MTTQDSTREALLVLDAGLNVRAANRAFYTMFRLAPEECVGHKVYELGGRAWDEKLRPMLETVLQGEPQADHFELIHDDKEGGNGVLWLSARLVPSAPRHQNIGDRVPSEAIHRRESLRCRACSPQQAVHHNRLSFDHP